MKEDGWENGVAGCKGEYLYGWNGQSKGQIQGEGSRADGMIKEKFIGSDR